MTYDVGKIQVLAWDRHYNVVGLNRLYDTKLPPLDNWRSNSNAYIASYGNIVLIRFHLKDHMQSQK
jgi:hypothetical protein